MFLLSGLVHHSNGKSDLIDDLELSPVVVEVLSCEVKLLSVALSITQYLCIYILFLSRIALIDREFEVLVADFADFLLR